MNIDSKIMSYRDPRILPNVDLVLQEMNDVSGQLPFILEICSSVKSGRQRKSRMKGRGIVLL